MCTYLTISFDMIIDNKQNYINIKLIGLKLIIIYKILQTLIKYYKQSLNHK